MSELCGHRNYLLIGQYCVGKALAKRVPLQKVGCWASTWCRRWRRPPPISPTTSAPRWPIWTQRARTGSGYSAIQGTRSQTIGYALTDSPAGLCARIAEKLWAWTDHPGDLGQVLTKGQVLDNITLYWLTGTAASSAWLYWESIAEVTAWFTTAASDTITVPAGYSIFPEEVPRSSRRWAPRRFTNIVYWNQPGRGGHFAAWEQPGLFTSEVRAIARSCRPELQ